MIATDLDGTIIGYRHTRSGRLSPRTITALRGAHDAGVEVVFVTGRPLRWLGPLSAQLGPVGPVICSNGAVVVETIFGWPGIGKLMIDSILQRDFAVLQAAVLLTAVAIFALNILIDMGYALLDARVRPVTVKA